MLEDIDILKHIESIDFSHIDSDNNCLNLEKNSIYKNFICKNLRITSDIETRTNTEVVNEISEESLTSYETLKENDNFFFCLNIKFKEHSSYKFFEKEFSDFFESNNKSYLFWVRVKVMYNEKLAEYKAAEMEKLLQEIVDIEFFVKKSLKRK